MSEEASINPMQADGAVTRVRLCGAKTRAGHPCRASAMPNGRCRMHGGSSPGAPKGNRNAWKHGLRSAEQAEWRAILRIMRAELAALATGV